jgi:hypothetical protein
MSDLTGRKINQWLLNYGEEDYFPFLRITNIRVIYSYSDDPD